MSASLAERDVDGVLSVLGLAASLDGPHPFELRVIERLVELIPADRAGYWEYEDGRDGSEAFSVSPGNTCEAFDRWWNAIHADGLINQWPLRDDLLRPLGATFTV